MGKAIVYIKAFDFAYRKRYTKDKDPVRDRECQPVSVKPAVYTGGKVRINGQMIPVIQF